MTAKKKNTHAPTPRLKVGPNTPLLTLDEEEFPLVKSYGIGPEVKYPEAYKMVDTLKPEKSAWFLTEHRNILDAIRKRVQKMTSKKFVIKKVDDTKSRIWRMKDNAKVGRRGSGLGNGQPWSEKRRQKFEEKHGKKVAPAGEFLKKYKDHPVNETNNQQ